MGGAATLTILAVTHTVTTPAFRCFATPSPCLSRDPIDERHLSGWFLTGGIAAGLTGIGMYFSGASQQKKADTELRQLQDTGRQRGWRISLQPDLDFKRLQMRIAYSW